MKIARQFTGGNASPFDLDYFKELVGVKGNTCIQSV
jgi:hypothetical protein